LWLSVGGGTAFLCALLTALVLRQALSSTTIGLGALTEHRTQLDSRITALRKDIAQMQRRGEPWPQQSDTVPYPRCACIQASQGPQGRM
jgi:hypothetical protein